MRKKLNIIVAMTEQYLIGTITMPIPWKLTDDFMENFVPKTVEGRIVIMGRKTFETLRDPLLGRVCIVITRNTELKREGFIFVKDQYEAMTVANSSIGETVWCIGGAEIYKLFQNTFIIDEYHISIIKDFQKEIPINEMILFAPNLKDYKIISKTGFPKRDPNPDVKRDKGNEYPFDVLVFKKEGFNAPLF